MNRILLFICLTIIHQGCAIVHRALQQNDSASGLSTFEKSAPQTITLYFYRQWSYKGQGRPHIMKIDNRPVGELTADNCFRMELWPGEYHFAVFVPGETFFGQTHPPMSIGKRLLFKPQQVGKIFACQYSDGMNSHSFELKSWPESASVIKGRILEKELSARDTAQVKTMYDTRYDGPAMHGQAHGMGTLSWSDGGIYKGVFEYGEPTNEGKFIFPNGLIYMGPLYKGRPKGPGVLMTPDGRIVYTGKLKDEKPNGLGIRTGDQGPEYCTYANGLDTTKSIRQLAKEALEAEDRKRAEERSKSEKIIEAAGAKTHGNTATPLVEAGSPRKIGPESIQVTPYARELAMRKKIRKEQQKKIAVERSWCENEFSQGRKWCICAPFDENAGRWKACKP